MDIYFLDFLQNMDEMSEDIDNPWDAKHLDDFMFLCCPECSFKSKLEEDFEVHAVDNHPLAKLFFHKENCNLQIKLEDGQSEVIKTELEGDPDFEDDDNDQQVIRISKSRSRQIGNFTVVGVVIF